MIDFLLLYENKNREIESLCLLKMELERRGYHVVLEQVQYFCKKKYKTKVVIVPFLYSNNDIYKYIYCICGMVDKVINIRWEQIYSRKMEKDLSSFFYPKDEAKKVIQLCWGKMEADNLLKLGISKELLFVVGPIHLDLITKSGYFRSRDFLQKRYKLEGKKKWILFISSFSNATFSEKERIEAVKILGKERIDFIELSIETRKMILEWFERLLEDNENYEIIYRPHPSEKKDDFLMNFEAVNKRFHIIVDESVGQWISCSDYVLNWYSTSAVQSQLLGKGNVLLRPMPIPDEIDVEIFSDAIIIDTYSKLVDFLSESLNHAKVDSTLNQYYFFDSTYAYQRIADICQKVLNSDSSLQINYDKILQKIRFFVKVKFEVLYKLYVPILRYLSKKKMQIFSNRSISYDMVIRNTVTEDELHSIEERIDALMLDKEI